MPAKPHSWPDPLRLDYEGALYHVRSRGDRQECIFETDTDRRIHWLCHVCCLTDNHYQLLIETSDANLSLGMGNLNGWNTLAFNRKSGKPESE